ncbi:MAG: hypothetical protein QHH06_00150 [Clostridiales bacterium]|jgi:hypothetical protein|nr:hypothetical protein [Eubacteriales bacterium]MDH7564881.1 hypothetical protein [Clostridiales bacterium]
MTDNKSFTARKIALGGILLALTSLTLFAAAVSPTGKLSLYVLSSFYIAVVLMEFGIKAGWVFYPASCMLAFLALRGNVGGLFSYIAFFGIYGIVKFYAEKIKNPVVEYIFKAAYFNAVLVAAIFFARQVLSFDPIRLEIFPVWAVILASEVVFFLYDYVYSLFIQYYYQKIRKRIKL